MTREEFNYTIKGCGCFIYRGHIYYEETELIKAFEDMGLIKQEPSGDLINRQDAIKAIDEKAKRIKNEDTLNGLAGAVGILFDLPSYNSTQESSITWVTGADGAKIAFWDVPVWKVTKICEILGEPQERSEE